jgi:EAL domain-containing protein (putative c-di-GMP-specific phosphodiesterase class I)
LSVNVSGRQLQTPELVATVERIVRETGITPADLVLELTESSLMDDVDVVVARLRELKRLGVRIAVDDFGTGFSSLGYLEQFPVDILKVAKPFVDGVHEDRRKAGLAQAVVNLAMSLELRTVAEGIELDEQRRRLVELGCELGQGYLFARPLPVASVPAALGISVAA